MASPWVRGGIGVLGIYSVFFVLIPVMVSL